MPASCTSPSRPPRVLLHNRTSLVDTATWSSATLTTRKMWETQWCKYMQYHSNWIEEKHGSLMVVATVIATMTFQSAVSPPGGVWQEDTLIGGLNCTTYGICQVGNAVLAYVSPHAFLQFMTFNTLSLFYSLSVVLLLISGLRLNNRPMMGILLIIAFTALTSMGRTYFFGTTLGDPRSHFSSFSKVVVGHPSSGQQVAHLSVVKKSVHLQSPEVEQHSIETRTCVAMTHFVPLIDEPPLVIEEFFPSPDYYHDWKKGL
ncbi:hypothetical protein Fmac_030263 [Flemingia macrophylla]|uniref:PGG domain-containing protein n=1 Tax=Flemingia macrophylla TaxID=520843 RepID=A0ABD1LCP5_9FABA